MWLSPDLPFAPRRVPFYYGWVVVVAATLGVLFSIPGQTMGVSVFTDPLLEATGLGRSSFSFAYLLGTLGSAALLPRAGVVIDRVGVRVAAGASALALGAVLLVLAQADRAGAALAGLLGLSPSAGAFAVLAVLFVGLRFSGQGVLTLVSRTMIGRWFDARRGRATAVSGLFVAFGFAYAPVLFEAWITRAGWRGAWTEMGFVVALAMTAVAFVFFREDPESAGLVLDGGVTDSRAAGQAELAFTRAEALRTRAFWVLTLALALQGMVVTGITFHVVDLGAESGLAKREAIALFPPLAVVSTSAGFVVGWLADRVSLRALVLLFLGAETLGYAASAHLGHAVGLPLAALGLGVAGGCFSVLTTVGPPRLFGRRHLAAIAGSTMTVVVAGSALGPLAMAGSRELLGSYTPALYLAAALPWLVGLGALRPLRPGGSA
ncbi:MAG: MFS transporter [Myxococcota bacterium]